MPDLNSRPMLMGTRGAVTSGHYLATEAGWRIARAGGNAVDVAAAVCFCLTLLEPRDTTPGGEAPTLIYVAAEKKVYALSGVGWAPEALTVDWCRTHGLDLIPGDGYVPACVPSVVGTWALALERFGTMGFAEVTAPVVELAERGFPVYPALRKAIAANRERWRERYPSTCEVYLAAGRVPEVGELLRNPDFADAFRLMARAEERAAGGRAAGIRAARDAFYRGEIAERIVSFIHENPAPDDAGGCHAGLLSLEDMAGWEPRLEEPVTLEHEGLTVHKCPTWTQGPVFLQQLALVRGFDLRAMGAGSAQYMHTVIECAKLAFADREAYYGDPLFDDVPFDVLLGQDYNAARRALVGDEASTEMRPGDVGRGFPEYATRGVREDNRLALGLAGEPGTCGANHDRDTSHLDVVDSAGNMVASTPSGGWFSSSPVIPGCGFPLGTRAQMFYLNPERPNALEPRKRPRATLTPTVVTRGGEPFMAFGMRGGDIQDQQSLHFFLNHVEFGMDVQSALDAPDFHVLDFPNSFYPRGRAPGKVFVLGELAPEVADDLERRGHRIEPVTEGSNLMGIRVDAEQGVLMAGVRSSGEHAYALAW